VEGGGCELSRKGRKNGETHTSPTGDNGTHKAKILASRMQEENPVAVLGNDKHTKKRTLGFFWGAKKKGKRKEKSF